MPFGFCVFEGRGLMSAEDMKEIREDGFPNKNVGNDSLSDEFSFRGNEDVKKGSGITDSFTRGFTILVKR